MIEKRIEVKIPTGLETTPVAMFVQVAGQFSSNIYVSLEDKKVNGKSIMGMMSLGILEGEDVIVSVDGEDEKVAMEKIEAYLLANEE